MDDKDSTKQKNLPYRPGVGLMIVNREGLIFVGKRVDTKLDGWQMPQGGIDIGETPSRAALREMEEEIGSSKGEIVGETRYWYSYDLPAFLVSKLWDGAFRGQKQKWFLIKFTGTDQDININTKHPEFVQWRWTGLEELPRIIVPFKHKLYSSVIKEFKPILNLCR